MRGLFMLWLALSPAVESTPLVTCTITTPSILGGNVNLTCEFKANLDVLQVTWQKKRGKDIQNMVTHSEKYGINIARPFQQRIQVLRASSGASSIRILKLTREDQACYDCLFNAYPNGAYTGEVCLKELQLINEVSCNAEGNDLRVKLDPQEIETRPSVPEVSTVHGHFTNTINPSCTFQKEQSKRIKRNAREGPTDPVQGADEVVHIKCKASGTTRFDISWQNEERPLSTEYITNVTGNVTTVSSTLVYTLSSFPADQEIICNIIHSSESQLTQSASDRQLSSTDGSQDDSGKQNHSWDRYPIYIVAACILLVVVVLIVILYKARKKMEVKTPRKIKIDNDEQVTPISVKVTTYGTATPLSHINLSTQLMGDQAKCKEPSSSVTKRKVSPREKTALKKKLAF